MNGDAVRGACFLEVDDGYVASDVDDLLGRAADALDAGEPVGPLVKNAAFRRRMQWSLGFRRGTRDDRRYDVDAVDWFLRYHLRQLDRPEKAVMAGRPWLDLSVTQIGRSTAGDEPSRLPTEQPAAFRNHFDKDEFAKECRASYLAFAELPGRTLTWGWMGSFRDPFRYEIRADQQILASRGSGGFRVGERVFGGRKGRVRGAYERSWPGGLEAAALRSGQDKLGQFAEGSGPAGPVNHAGALFDEIGATLLHQTGINFNGRAYARISFPDQRSLRFLVRGLDRWLSVMTAVDENGIRAARFRVNPSASARVEIKVNPDWNLTDELLVAFMISAPWLASYFELPET